MPKTPHQLIFENLSPEAYFKTTESAARHIRGFRETFPDSLGHDESTDGFIVIHIGHSRASLHLEMPACLVLKNAGYAVVLLEESSYHKSPDVRINSILLEIKYISKAKNLKNAIAHQFRTAKRKSENLLLHLDQPIKAERLRSALFYAVQKFATIAVVWIVWRKQLHQFDRDTILKGRHQFR